MSNVIRHIVNDQDELLAFKRSQDIDYEIEIYRVSALWITNAHDEVLLAQRKITQTRDGGKWGPAVAGTVEQGEDYEINIYKEAEEEIGLTGVIFEIGPKQLLTGKRNYFCQWFTLMLDRDAADFVLQADEVEKLQWIPKLRLGELVKTHPHLYVDAFAEAFKVLR